MIKSETIKKFRADFAANKANLAVAGAIQKIGIDDASLNHAVVQKHNFMFSETTKKGDITEQKHSGRCWMFAALNTARVDTMKKYNLKTTEFSQTYTLFWDKLERSNYVLDAIIETADQPLDSRVVAFLLKEPLGDGGQWDMFKGLLKKYGIVPKTQMPETFHSSDTKVMNAYLTSMLRFFASQLRAEYDNSKDVAKLQAMKQEMLSKIYNILVKALGNPPETVNYEYEDADGKYHRLPTMTPQEFFNEVVGWNLADRVSVINAPTKDKPYGKVYTVKYLGNITEDEPIRYLNVPTEVMKQAAIAAIKDGEPVWFGCDVGKLSNRMLGIMDNDIYNYQLTMDYYPEWDKEKRLDYYESQLTHAMVFTGVNLDDNGQPINWQVENSWGKEPGKDGIFSMSDQWFDTFMYQIMIDKKYLPKEWQAKLTGELVELAPWDPMGSLAL